MIKLYLLPNGSKFVRYFRHRWYCPRWDAFPCPSGGTAILVWSLLSSGRFFLTSKGFFTLPPSVGRVDYTPHQALPLPYIVHQTLFGESLLFYICYDSISDYLLCRSLENYLKYKFCLLSCGSLSDAKIGVTWEGFSSCRAWEETPESPPPSRWTSEPRRRRVHQGPSWRGETPP